MEEKLKQIIKEAIIEAISEMGITGHNTYPEVMNLDQAAAFVHLTKDYIKNKKDELKIPHRRKGRSYLFLKSELVEWMQQREEEKKSEISIRPAKTKKGTVRLV